MREICLKIQEFAALHPKLGPNSLHTPRKFENFQFLRPYYTFAKNQFFRPLFRSSMPDIPTKTKLSAPPPLNPYKLIHFISNSKMKLKVLHFHWFNVLFFFVFFPFFFLFWVLLNVDTDKYLKWGHMLYFPLLFIWFSFCFRQEILCCVPSKLTNYYFTL